jgi:tRNA U34 2-thiouridine synthase MnmA/TrmU
MTVEQRCSKASILKQRFNFKDDYLIESLCHSLNITVKQLEDFEKEYWENISKVIMGTYDIR